MKSPSVCILVAALIMFQSGSLAHPQNDNDSSGPTNDEIASDDVLGAPLGEDDFKAAELVDDANAEFEVDPIQTAGLFEGDIDNIDKDAFADFSHIYANARNAIRNNKWPNAEIPYVISASYSAYERSVIANAIKSYHEKTCIRFKPRSTESGYIHIMKGSGCSSYVGRTGSVQYVSLANGCVYTGIVIHEFMHAAGFWHEQSRADRDDHVKINWGNIISGMSFNFQKYGLDQIDHLGAAYDTCSVMHYGAYAFSSNGQTTISVIRQGQCSLGQREGFSDTDVRKINTLYKCTGYPQVTTATTKPPTTTTTTVTTSCLDKSEHCGYWRETDECEKSADWMKTNCPMACGLCKCQDTNESCIDWAKIGECTNNPEYMNIYCAKACKTCLCEDGNEHCGYWKDMGYCTNSDYKEYMEENCKKSCGVC